MTVGAKGFGLGVGIIHILLVCYAAAFPIHDIVYSWIVSSGETAYVAYGVVWWCVLLFVVMNIILPFILLGVIAGPENPSRADTHSIVAVFALVYNAAALIFFLFVLLAWTNTSYSGTCPFNDFRWCCVYWREHPELCPNTSPCTPAVTDAALQNIDQLYLFIGLAVAFFVLSGIHLIANRLLRISGYMESEKGKAPEGIAWGVIVAFVYLAIYCYWAAFPLWDTIFVDGYPLFAIPPSPGPYISNLYKWQWWTIWAQCFNLVPPIMFLGVVALKKSYLTTLAHYWSSWLMSFVSGVVFLVLLRILISDCNWGYSGGSICSDYRWCCQHFSSAPNYCPNVTPCDVSLFPNAQFLQHLVLSLVFSVFALVEVWINFRMQQYGVFQ